MVTDAEKVTQYKNCLAYILANLKQRSERKSSCATDENLVKHISWTLTQEGLETSVKVSKEISEACDEAA